MNKTKIIYLLDDGQNYKIGFTTPLGLQRRIKSLQTGNPRKIETIATVFGDGWLEKRLHKMFAGDRKTGEWFERSPAIKAWFLSSDR